MKRIPTFGLLFILICSACNLPSPSAPTTVSMTQTDAPATVDSTEPPATQVPPTDIAPNASVFPNPGDYTWQEIVSGLQRPVDLKADGSGRLFVIEKNGRIRIIQNGDLSPNPFLDITDRVDDRSNEMGLIGLAFHPQFAQNGYFYVNYTGEGGDTFISRFQANGDSADPGSELNLLKIDQPFPNHNGGSLVFGPDGYLYAGLGDGGSQGDPFANGQNVNSLLGKILRLDVNSAQPYAIPPDNPFGNEVWAHGLRNPWRISFDKLTGDLYIGDVGQNQWEEIDFVPAGTSGSLNFGWNLYEGSHAYQATGGDNTEFVFPIAEYSHAEGGCSVTGGYVYRGSLPEWNGIYLYGDYCMGNVWGLIHAGEQWQSQLLFETHTLITSFGEDENGELYLVSDDGSVYKLTGN
jgi:glucose/arabinose dehydrogenase